MNDGAVFNGRSCCASSSDCCSAALSFSSSASLTVGSRSMRLTRLSTQKRKATTASWTILVLLPSLLAFVTTRRSSFTDAFQSPPASLPSSLRLLEPLSKHHHHHHVTFHQTTKTATSLGSSPDPDLEYINEDGDDENAPLAVTPEPFESEVDIAQQANDLARMTSGSSASGSIDLPTEISNSFLQYALSIILGRALPDMRDGLKPVHRRILYSMHQLQLTPNTSHRKCARVVGEVLGKYHPHGDMAVYDALVRMAQSFSSMYPLVDGHGNFGSIDNDPAAAMRYTECRLTTMATATLLDELHPETVDYIPNFDGNEHEPTVLPSKLPLLLLNGSSGIAVGMATNIPPHNLREVMRACIALLETERLPSPTKEGSSDTAADATTATTLTDRQLFQLIPAPDFPTGASIMGTASAKKLYETGNGGIVMRAVSHVEKIGKRSAIIVTELPYQVNKAALLEHIAELVNSKKLEGIADLRDESDRNGIRVVLELKQRDAIPQVVLANLYQKTKLQTTFSGNLVALMKGNNNGKAGDDDNTSNKDAALTPQRFNLRQALNYFLDFRFDTIRRKTQHELQKVQARQHIVEGLLVALQYVDQVIDLIRTLPDPAACREALMATDGGGGGLNLGLSREQADSVLRLQLGQLTRLNQDKLQGERDDLQDKGSDLNRLLTEDTAVYQLMVTEFQDMDTKFGHDRRSTILQEDGQVQEMDLIENSRSVIVVTRGGYIKRMPLKTFENQGRGTRGKRGTSDTASSDDEVLHCITCNDHDTLLMITQNGIAFGITAYQVPSGSRTAKGTPLPSVLPISMNDVVTTVLPVSEFTKEEFIVLATEQGWIKKTPLDAFEKISSRGLTIASLNTDDKLRWCHRCTDQDDILMGSSNGMAVRFPASTLRPTGRTSRGVIAMRLREGDTIADMNVLAPASSVNGDNEDEYVLCVTEQGYGKRVPTGDFRSTSRGKVGVIAMKFKKQPNADRMSCFSIVKNDDEILLNTSRGIMVRQKVEKIPRQSRSATGVVVQKVDNTDCITSVSVVPITASDDE